MATSANNAFLPFWSKPLGVFLLLAYFTISLTMVIPSIKALTPVDSYNKNIYGTTVGHDFRIFYTAGTLANSGDFETLYDSRKLDPVWRSRFNITQEGNLHFSYPPTALMLWAPLAKLSHLQALILWITIPLLGTLFLLYRLTGSYVAIFVTLISPIFLRAIITGQTGLIITLLLTFGLYSLDRKRPVIAGISFGLMAIKPHLALALPLCLMLKKEWTTLATGALTLFAMILLSLIVIGPEAWAAFFQNFGQSITIDDAGQSYTFWGHVMVMTGNASLAYAIHATGAIFAIFITVYTWKNTDDFAARLITLFMLPAFISPYFHIYDLTHFVVIYALMAKILFTQSLNNPTPLFLISIWVLGYSAFKPAIYSHMMTLPFFLILLMALPLWLVRDTMQHEKA